MRITVSPGKSHQEFQGLGCGAMFFEGHVTSLAVRQKNDRQRELYDDMFAKVNTRYPTRKGGEALINVDWGSDYFLKKTYWVFRQWSTPLEAGMRVVESSSSGNMIRVASFYSAGRKLVVHVTNSTDAAIPVQLAIAGANVAPPGRQRTSATENAASLAPLPASPAGFADTLPARSFTTFQFLVK